MATTPSVIPAGTAARPTTRPVVAGAALGAATLLAVLINVGIGAIAPALGADPRFDNFAAAHVALFSVVGAALSIGGWFAVVRFVRRSRRALTVLVPALFVLTALPNVAIMAGALPIPHSGVAEGALLLLMHVVLVAALVPVLARVAPPR